MVKIIPFLLAVFRQAEYFAPLNISKNHKNHSTMNQTIQSAFFRIALAFILIHGSATFAFSQTQIEAPVSGFLILVETTDNGLKLTCEEGCAWGELSFSLNGYRRQAIDQYGMTSLKRDQPAKSDRLSNFLFTVKKTKEGLKFEGKEGTAWSELSFNCPDNICYQHIDQEGMARRE